MTIAALMVYSMAVSVLVSAAAWLSERALGTAGRPTRWVWLAALALCVALPALAARGQPEPTVAPTQLEPVGVEASALEVAPAAGNPGPLEPIGALLGAISAKIERWLASGATRFRDHAPSAEWIATLWAIASSLLAAALMGSMVRLGRRAKAGSRERLLGRDVRVTADLGPATIGFLTPEIVLPGWVRRLPEDELALVLAHEEAHARAKDPLLLAIGLIPALAVPWNPIMWWQFKRLREAVEVDCDRRVIRGGVRTSPYGNLLVKLRTRARGAALAPSMSSTPSLLERRLNAMRKTRSWHAIPRAALSGVAAIALLAVACTTDAPMADTTPQADTQTPLAAVIEAAVTLRVEADGAVQIDGLPFELDEVSDELARLDGTEEDPLVVFISGDEDVSHGVMSGLQDEIIEGGVNRVVFQMPGDPRPDRGFSIVLPTSRQEVPVSGRNLLHLVVQPDGIVDVRRGQSPQVQRLRPADIEGLWSQEVARNARLIAAVRVHPDADFAHTVGVVRALRAAEAERISIQRLPVEPAAGPSTPAPSATVQRITIDFTDTPLSVVLSAFSRLSGKTIEVAEAVTGTVTVALEDQPWEAALRVILRSLDLEATEGEDGVVRVDRAR